jgi:hypothetical protein
VIRRIAAISIPSEQSTDRKAVAQVVDMRWRSARRDRDVQLRDQGMESMLIVPGFTGRPPMNENTGVSGDALGTCTDLLSMKA